VGVCGWRGVRGGGGIRTDLIRLSTTPPHQWKATSGTWQNLRAAGTGGGAVPLQLRETLKRYSLALCVAVYREVDLSDLQIRRQADLRNAGQSRERAVIPLPPFRTYRALNNLASESGFRNCKLKLQSWACCFLPVLRKFLHRIFPQSSFPNRPFSAVPDRNQKSRCTCPVQCKHKFRFTEREVHPGCSISSIEHDYTL
jgi:hypothetical protein